MFPCFWNVSETFLKHSLFPCVWKDSRQIHFACWWICLILSSSGNHKCSCLIGVKPLLCDLYWGQNQRFSLDQWGWWLFAIMGLFWVVSLLAQALDQTLLEPAWDAPAIYVGVGKTEMNSTWGETPWCVYPLAIKCAVNQSFPHPVVYNGWTFGRGLCFTRPWSSALTL